jgi:hypothetical protein
MIEKGSVVVSRFRWFARDIICSGRDLFVAWHRAINDDADHFSFLSHPWSLMWFWLCLARDQPEKLV